MTPEEFSRFFYDLFLEIGFPPALSAFFGILLNLTCVLILAYFLSKILRVILVKVFKKAFSRANTQFDDYFLENKVFINLTNLLMLFIVKAFIPAIFVHFKAYVSGIVVFLDILILCAIIWTIRSFFNTIKSYLKTLDSFKNKPVDSYVQVLMILVWMLGFILVFSLITGDTPWEFLTALGAISAVILLIFKDTILGFVASIQISVNDTVRIGDWITMEKFGADGFVIEINLNTVLVSNWDKTITSIPTYYLNSEPFTNWRGMEESGGRRIMRSIFVKASTVRFLTAEEIDELGKIALLKDYIQDWKTNVGQKRKGDPASKSFFVNERHLTNLGVFRKYINLYLQKREDVHQEGFLMICRQLEATPQGIPLQIYAFSKHVSFVDIEPQKGEIFDHLFAIIHLFHLDIFEFPSEGSFNPGMLVREKT
ncbi:MAG TPA: mechanosensitive ion channel domain-containing protein [Flavobacteriaceae bacterium]|nr:mechanosensitive ion channel domain-containing protein [Flavobacteriaceae bacterium]